MDTALDLPTTSHWKRHLQYRDGLIIALLSLWPIRRRSIAALTVDRHLVFDDAGVTVVLDAADTKGRRDESCRLPSELVPYLRRYVDEIRPHLLHGRIHPGLWPSRKGGATSGGRIYDAVRKRIIKRFGKDMSLHDFRRSAATYIAIDAPDKIGLIPGVLQHANPEVAEQHYNLANSIKAGKRYNATLSDLDHAPVEAESLKDLAMRAVIYARYSSENQREASIEDQIEVCRRYIGQQQWTLIHSYADRAISGASDQRPEYQQMIADAQLRSLRRDRL